MRTQSIGVSRTSAQARRARDGTQQHESPPHPLANACVRSFFLADLGLALGRAHTFRCLCRNDPTSVCRGQEKVRISSPSPSRGGNFQRFASAGHASRDAPKTAEHKSSTSSQSEAAPRLQEIYVTGIAVPARFRAAYANRQTDQNWKPTPAPTVALPCVSNAALALNEVCPSPSRVDAPNANASSSLR